MADGWKLKAANNESHRHGTGKSHTWAEAEESTTIATALAI
jgi:hypothetical protein